MDSDSISYKILNYGNKFIFKIFVYIIFLIYRYDFIIKI